MDTNTLRSLLATGTLDTLLEVTFPRGAGPKQEISKDVAQGPLTSFQHMFFRGMLTMEKPMQVVVLQCIIESCRWEFDANRVFLVRINHNFDLNRFITHVGESVESVVIR